MSHLTSPDLASFIDLSWITVKHHQTSGLITTSWCMPAIPALERQGQKVNARLTSTRSLEPVPERRSETLSPNSQKNKSNHNKNRFKSLEEKKTNNLRAHFQKRKLECRDSKGQQQQGRTSAGTYGCPCPVAVPCDILLRLHLSLFLPIAASARNGLSPASLLRSFKHSHRNSSRKTFHPRRNKPASSTLGHNSI